jgi:hypothetical protein
MFEYRFKRKPKVWTVHEVHNLWMRAKSRNSKRRKEFDRYLNWITTNVKPNNGKNWIIYYSDTSFYELENHYKYGLTHRTGYSKNDRNSKIDSIITQSETIEIGKKLKYLERLISRAGSVVKSHLDRLIEKEKDVKKLREKSWGHGVKDIFIRIDDRVYLYRLEGHSNIVMEIKENEIINI